MGGAAGVGKTYRMFEVAHQLSEQGHDVVLGFVETMEKLGIEVPEPTVNIADIRRKYHEDVDKEKGGSKKRK